MNESPFPVRLLVVDDDPVVSRLVCHQVAGAGFVPVAAATAAEARVRLAGEAFDLILLDVGLPDEDGYAFCRELKSSPAAKDLPVIFLTARGAEPEVLRGFEAGGVDYVVKPFDPQVLLARLSTHATLARLSRDLQSALDARTASLQLAHRRMRELDAQMALAVERERRCLADRLHDTTIQQLVLARILLDQAQGAGSATVLGRVGPLLDLSLGQLRTLVFELSPPVLYQAGLFAALDWLAGQLGGHWPVGYRCRLEGEPVALPDDLKVILFQGARELMTNVGRHARARTCAVVLSFERGVLRLAVEDDGVGIDAAPPPGPAQDRDRVRGAGGGFGLFSLRSRIELLGGGLQVRRGEAGGTRATLWVPLPGPVPEDRSGGAGRQGGGRSTNHFEDGDRSP